MANSADENGIEKKSPGPLERPDFEKRLSALDDKLSKAKKSDEVEETLTPRGAYSYAFRIASELIAAPVVGAFIGWWIDRALGTTPIMLLILLVLGMVAGIINVMRTAEEMQKKHGTGQDTDNEI